MGCYNSTVSTLKFRKMRIDIYMERLFDSGLQALQHLYYQISISVKPGAVKLGINGRNVPQARS